VASQAQIGARGVTCNFCGGLVPLPEGREETFCVDCGKGFRFLDRIEVWFNQFWERYVPT
jgi:hypothetical protein